MPPKKSDDGYLWDMLDAARSVSLVVSGRTYDEHLADKLLRSAVERQTEIIGEAARHVSDVTQHAHQTIPWRLIAAQRHVLAHDYGEVKHDRIWRVATIHVPELNQWLESIVPPAPT